MLEFCRWPVRNLVKQTERQYLVYATKAQTAVFDSQRQMGHVPLHCRLVPT